MASLLRAFKTFLGLPNKGLPQAIAPDFSVFKGKSDLTPTDDHGANNHVTEGDRVLIQGRKPILTKPIRKNDKTDMQFGSLEHNAIIGKSSRDVVQTSKGLGYRITAPTLDEYVTLTPRKVTPVYAADANLIVSLLDLHVPAPSTQGTIQRTNVLEILEAGTGHGSLTLHLARAIHAANPTPPSWPPPRRTRADAVQAYPKGQSPDATSSNDNLAMTQWATWRSQRRAIIHTVDIAHSYSKHAEKIVHEFRRGIYAPHVDFHVANVKDWIAGQVAKRRKVSKHTDNPFVTHVILDMPSSHEQIENVAPIIRADGLLLLFAPSITQIGDGVRIIKERRLPFTMEKVVELGSGISNGREWDVRLATRRTGSNETRNIDPDTWAVDGGEAGESAQAEDMADYNSNLIKGSASDKANMTNQEVMVCRPKVGKYIVGGGFVGLWRRMKET